MIQKDKEWVYYIPKLNMICIVFPEYRDENDLTPVEVGYDNLSKIPKDFNFDETLLFLGEL